MNFTDMAALAVKGMSISDIKELKDLSKTNPEVIEIAKTGTTLQDIKELVSLSEAEEENSGEASQGETGESHQTPPDFEKMYKEQLQKTEELEKKVSEIQKDNARKDLSGEEKHVDAMLDILQAIK